LQTIHLNFWHTLRVRQGAPIIITVKEEIAMETQLLKAAEKPEADKIDISKNVVYPFSIAHLTDLLTSLAGLAGKKNFLVYKNNKYINVPTENIACFYIKYQSSAIMCFNQQEYFVDYSLDQAQELLSRKQFFRLNRQYLINFNAIKEVEHYFSRKLLVNAVIPMKEKLVIPREKASEFLNWLDNR
jgi:two-component system, LytTR family, response regulator LytT